MNNAAIIILVMISLLFGVGIINGLGVAGPIRNADDAFNAFGALATLSFALLLTLTVPVLLGFCLGKLIVKLNS